jgi:hypothetical protein
MHDRVPAGELTLTGAFFTEHRQEVMNLIHNAESEGRAEHPLERIMDIVEGEDRTVITLTDAHLVHGIGEALHPCISGRAGFRIHRWGCPLTRLVEPLATPESMVAVHVVRSMAAWEAALNRVA